jgi:hypothetical protein
MEQTHDMKIKECPFCGAKVKKPTTAYVKQPYIDHAVTCWIGKGRTQTFDPKEVPFWNRRHK